jgi:hypothetical protein
MAIAGLFGMTSGERVKDWYHTGHVLDLDMSRLEALGESSPY